MRRVLEVFDDIMVRDPYTQSFVDELVGARAASRVVDPTLLWDFNAESPPNERPYLLLTGALCNNKNMAIRSGYL